MDTPGRQYPHSTGVLPTVPARVLQPGGVPPGRYCGGTVGVLQGTVGSTLQYPGVLQGTVAVPPGVSNLRISRQSMTVIFTLRCAALLDIWTQKVVVPTTSHQ